MFSSPNSQTISLLNQNQSSVFRISDVALLTGETNRDRITQRLLYAVKNGLLLNPSKGIYAKKDFSFLELACKLYSPSYVSLETVLQKAGVIFQYSESTTMVSYLSRNITVDDIEIRYRKIKNSILLDTRGISRGEINEATPERAFLDTLYLNSQYHFDNPSILDINKVNELLPIYNSPTLTRRALKILNHD